MAVIVDDATALNIDNQAICDFYNQHWKRGIALSIPSFYKWQFTGSPSDEGKDHCMLAIDASSRQVLGVMGLNSRSFLLNDSGVRGAELTTWIIDEKHQGSGLGARILKQVQNRYDVLLGMGISDMALPIYLKCGFRYIKAIPRFLKVFDLGALAEFAKYSPLAGQLVKRRSTIAMDCDFRIEKVNESNIAAIMAASRKKFNYFDRGYKHLLWRYAAHPLFEYKMYVVYSANSNQGVLVCFREETGIDKLRILHVLDCIGDATAMTAALGFIHNYCQANDFHVADFYCTTSQVTKYFIEAGWFSTIDDACFQFPHLFHPVELRIPPTTSMIYWSKVNSLEMHDMSKLYVTKQDADLDRPTLYTYQQLQAKTSPGTRG